MRSSSAFKRDSELLASRCEVAPTIMRTSEDRVALAQVVLALARAVRARKEREAAEERQN